MSVAPSLVASCSLAGLVSIAMMRPAPAIAAPLIAAMPTPPQPITATVSPAVNLGGVHHRAVAGDDAAADQRREIERHVLADFDDGVLVHQHLLGEGRQVEELVELLRARPGQPVGLRRAASSRSVSVQSTVRPVVQLSQVPQNTDRQVTT